MTIEEILKQYASIINNAPNKFYDAVTEVEIKILNELLNFIMSFDIKDGRLFSRKENQNILIQIDKKLETIWNKSGIRDSFKSFLQDYDLANKLSKKFYRETLRSAEQKDITKIFKQNNSVKAKIVENVSARILNFDFVSLNAFDELRDDIYNAIVFNQNLDELTANVRRSLISTEGANSKVLRYVKQISNDALLQHERTVHANMQSEFELDGFIFANSLIKTSRQPCRWMVEGSGPLTQYAIRPGVYRWSDIPAIFKIVKAADEGFNPRTTVETYTIFLNGFGCRHVAMPIRLIEDDLN